MKSKTNEVRAPRLTREKTSQFFLSYSLYIILAAIVVITICVKPNFLSVRNITNIITMASARSIIAMGIAGVLVIRGTELSAGRVVGCCCAVTASLLQTSDFALKFFPNLGKIPLVVAWLCSILVAVAFALVIGLCVSRLKMPAFIASLGVQLVAYGLLCFYLDLNGNNGTPISNLDERYTEFVKGGIQIGNFEIPYLLFYMIIAAVIMWIVWNKTVFGRNMFAIGGNMEAAEVSGIKIERGILLVFILSGICVGTGAFLECARIGSVTATTGTDYQFDAISACVIGGVSFSGGTGTIPGVITGVLIMQTINYCLYFLGVSSYLQYIVKGIVIVLAVALDTRKYIKRK